MTGEHPLRHSTLRQLRISRVTTLLLLLILIAMNGFLISDPAPQGMISLQVAGTPERIQHILNGWNGLELTLVRCMLVIEYLFAASYVVLLLSFSYWLLKDYPGVRDQQSADLARSLFILAGGADMVENTALLLSLSAPEDEFAAGLAVSSTVVKLSALLIGAALLLIVRTSRGYLGKH